MELRYRREATVGALLIIGAASFVLLMMWLRGKSFGKGDIVRVTFPDVAGLKVGDPVRTSGVRVGAVSDIVLESPGFVHVYLDVRKGPPPRVDARARIQSADLFGARYIEYDPGRADRLLPADSMLRGVKMQDLSELAEGLGERSRALIDTANAVALMVSRELRSTLRSTQTLMATLNSGASGSSEQLIGALEELRHSLQRVDQLLAQNAPAASEAITGMRNTAVRADTLTRTLALAAARLDSLLAKANSGRGPLPALLNDSTTLRDLMATNTALRDLLLDFRANPGRYIRLRLF